MALCFAYTTADNKNMTQTQYTDCYRVNYFDGTEHVGRIVFASKADATLAAFQAILRGDATRCTTSNVRTGYTANRNITAAQLPECRMSDGCCCPACMSAPIPVSIEY